MRDGGAAPRSLRAEGARAALRRGGGRRLCPEPRRKRPEPEPEPEPEAQPCARGGEGGGDRPAAAFAPLPRGESGDGPALGEQLQ